MDFVSINKTTPKVSETDTDIARYCCDRSGKIINANDTFLSLVQWNKEEIFNKMSFQDFLPIGGKVYYNTQYFPLLELNGTVKEIKFELVRKDKTKLPIVLNSYLDGDGQCLVHSSIHEVKENKADDERIQDKAKIQEMKEEISKLKYQLNKKNEIIRGHEAELEQLNSIKNKFFNVVSHDMKSPLCGLSGYVSMFIENAKDFSREEVLKVSHQLKESIDGTIQLADNLTTWAQSQMKDFDLHPEILNPEEIILEILELTAPNAQKKKIKLSYTVKDQMVLYGDRNQLTFIVRNLVNNAIKFTPTGGAVKIHISENEFGDSVIKVIDNGVGLSKSQIENLFSTVKNDSTLGTEGEKGTGMGLTLAGEFIKMHGGNIEVFSEGQGSTFQITLNPLDLNKKLLAI
ncbi:MAG: ATP-binding protein [Bacteroidota bacterium]